MNVYKFILFLIVFLFLFVFSLDVEKIAEYKKLFHENINEYKIAEIYKNYAKYLYCSDVKKKVDFGIKSLSFGIIVSKDGYILKSRANIKFSPENQKLLEDAVYEVVYSDFVNIKYSKNIYVGMGFIASVLSFMDYKGAELIGIDKSIDYSTGYPAYDSQGQMVGIASQALGTYLFNKTSFRGVSVQGYQDSYGIIL